MTNVCELKFGIFVNVNSEDADEVGKELAAFLRESFFNGEDVVEVSYLGHEVIKKEEEPI